MRERILKDRVGRAAAGVAAALLATGAASAIVRNVSTVGQLNEAVSIYSPGDEIVIAAGTYNLSNDLVLRRGPVTLRGATGDWKDVILVGGGMNDNVTPRIGVHVQSVDVTVRDLTISECYYHAIQFHGGANRTKVLNVRTLNIGEQHMKGVRFTADGEIAFCRMEQTKTRINDGVARPDNYVGGIDIIGGSRWWIHDNVALNIRGIAGGDAAIFLWQDIYDCVTERNVISGCTKGIAYGNPYDALGREQTSGGIVRNNFVHHKAGNDIGMEFCFTKDLKVYHNTIYSDDPNFFRTVQIYDLPSVRTVNLELAYNIIRGRIWNPNAAPWTNTGNLVGSAVQSNWFVDPAADDFHLTMLATAAIDQALTLADVPEDFDEADRPVGAAPDLGADEYLLGDVAPDGQVDLVDLIDVVNAFSATPGGPGWNPAADVDVDREVTVLDIIWVVSNFGAGLPE